MAVIADKCHHLNINVVDISQKRIDDWNNSDLDKLQFLTWFKKYN